MSWAPAFRRNLWLGQAVVDLRRLFRGVGLPLPTQVLVASGSTMVVNGMPALGQCMPSTARADKLRMITVNERLVDPVQILGVLVHELIHAADDCRSGHGPWFAAWARALGLTGPVEGSYASPELRRKLESIANGLGSYPQPTIGFNITLTGAVAA